MALSPFRSQVKRPEVIDNEEVLYFGEQFFSQLMVLLILLLAVLLRSL